MILRMIVNVLWFLPTSINIIPPTRTFKANYCNIIPIISFLQENKISCITSIKKTQNTTKQTIGIIQIKKPYLYNVKKAT